MRRARAVEGKKATLFGETPFGWRLSKDRTRLVLDPDEQRLLAVVRHMHKVQRLDMREIVTVLAHLGVVNRRGRPFALSAVWAMIRQHGKVPREARKKAK